jgi:hypothetical protein
LNRAEEYWVAISFGGVVAKINTPGSRGARLVDYLPVNPMAVSVYAEEASIGIIETV